ncbi:hypothetical protein M3699_21980 [Peribacillus simplex]|uniref:hypothetical protein n=1 Tax=Peribacillus simplex TaxID=1478 RepID=UPI00203CAFDC|nr:hypothetical protein [Peribacillus simplex]MCM3676448.1 hypothetical protein [Peribacillus simplex]
MSFKTGSIQRKRHHLTLADHFAMHEASLENKIAFRPSPVRHSVTPPRRQREARKDRSEAYAFDQDTAAKHIPATI